MGRTSPSAKSVALREALLLDPEDEWLRSKCFSHSQGYAQLQVGGQRVLLHRHLMGNPPCDVDHRNGIRLDCRKSNLRALSRSGNTINTDSVRAASGIRGVSFNKQKQRWEAKIGHNYKTIHLGLFPTLEQAAQARHHAEVNLYGEVPRSAAHA